MADITVESIKNGLELTPSTLTTLFSYHNLPCLQYIAETRPDVKLPTNIFVTIRQLSRKLEILKIVSLFAFDESISKIHKMLIDEELYDANILRITQIMIDKYQDEYLLMQPATLINICCKLAARNFLNTLSHFLMVFDIPVDYNNCIILRSAIEWGAKDVVIYYFEYAEKMDMFQRKVIEMQNNIRSHPHYSFINNKEHLELDQDLLGKIYDMSYIYRYKVQRKKKEINLDNYKVNDETLKRIDDIIKRTIIIHGESHLEYLPFTPEELAFMESLPVPARNHGELVESSAHYKVGTDSYQYPCTDTTNAICNYFKKKYAVPIVLTDAMTIIQNALKVLKDNNWSKIDDSIIIQSNSSKYDNGDFPPIVMAIRRYLKYVRMRHENVSLDTGASRHMGRPRYDVYFQADFLSCEDMQITDTIEEHLDKIIANYRDVIGIVGKTYKNLDFLTESWINANNTSQSYDEQLKNYIESEKTKNYPRIHKNIVTPQTYILGYKPDDFIREEFTKLMSLL